MRVVLRLLGVLLMLVGIYFVFFRESAGSITSTALVPVGVGAGALAPDELNSTDGDEASPNDGERIDGDPTPPTATVTTVIDPFQSTTIASTTGSPSDGSPGPGGWLTGDCDLSFKGYGVEMKPWGDIQLPYATGFPTSDPGEPPNCAPNTDFGGAIVAAHVAYLDAVRPELIPLLAVPGDGRDQRVEDHPGPLDPETLGYVCEPLGWQKHRDGSFLLYHLCGDSSTKVTKVPLAASDGRWQVEYPPDGVFETWSADAGETYYPFAGGD